jgi:hypothetical protein
MHPVHYEREQITTTINKSQQGIQYPKAAQGFYIFQGQNGTII